jgi:hypothetical protein
MTSRLEALASPYSAALVAGTLARTRRDLAVLRLVAGFSARFRASGWVQPGGSGSAPLKTTAFWVSSGKKKLPELDPHSNERV